MIVRLWRVLVFVVSVITVSIQPAHAFTTLFYALRDNELSQLEDRYRVLADINQHHRQIDILSVQAYVINAQGMVYKTLSTDLDHIARRYHLKLMPLVTNDNFNAKHVDQFLKNLSAQQLATKQLVNLCKTHHFYGLQIDFEHIPARDREAYTRFYRRTATALHAAHCKVSIAIVPQRHQIPPSTLLLKRNLYWAGAYDQKALAAVSDFVVLMTYNQHGGRSTPGPVAAVATDKLAITYALTKMPRHKILLGIPTASNYWLMRSTPNHSPDIDNSITAQGISISYQKVNLLQKRYHLKWRWDDYAKVHYAIFPFQDFYRYVFVEDADSFSAKQQLAKQYQLGGIAVFRLGSEDPNIWHTIH